MSLDVYPLVPFEPIYRLVYTIHLYIIIIISYGNIPAKQTNQ